MAYLCLPSYTIQLYVFLLHDEPSSVRSQLLFSMFATFVVVSLVITIVTFTFAHWVALGLALLVSWWVIESFRGSQS